MIGGKFMASVRKRVLSLFLALVMVFACTATVSASEVNTTSAKADIIIGPEAGTSSTSRTSRNFYVTSFGPKVSISFRIDVNAPCTFYLVIKDANGKSLGTSSLTATKSGTYTLVPSPSSFSGGTYYYEYWFDKSGVRYYFYGIPG